MLLFEEGGSRAHGPPIKTEVLHSVSKECNISSGTFPRAQRQGHVTQGHEEM